MENKKEKNVYNKQLVIKSMQNVYVSDNRDMDINTLVEKIKTELKKRTDKLSLKGSNYVFQTFCAFSLSATVHVKRLETDGEYKLRISNYEKSEETKRKREEEKIKREFKKLEELKQKFKDASSAEDAINKIRRKKAEDSILPNLITE